MQARLNCMPPAVACGARATRDECTGSFSSVSNTGEVLKEEFQLQHHQLPNHSKPFLGSPPEMENDDGDLQHIATGPSDPPPTLPAGKKKKKRSLPGTPDPSSEVIALSPKTLMATNRFVCEICHKGFQRDQNLQLHRRGHNLPWKLRQREIGEGGAGAMPRKRVYVCPEPSCVHHSPSRALGDLTGIKKHFCRKHGEKKWKCDRCAKRYAVHSDWKAHSKVCGTREYRCDCGTVFSRRDSFVTHRAFCDALAQENNNLAQPMNMATVASALQGQAAHHLMLPSQTDGVDMDADADMDADDASGFIPDIKSPHLKMFSDDAATGNPLGFMLSSLGGRRSAPSPSAFSGSKLSQLGLGGPSDATVGFTPASMSATALLQKAAEMGATTTTSGYGAGFSTPGLGSTMAGLDRFPTAGPFGPMGAHSPYVGLPSGPAQLVGFGVGGLMPGQLYSEGAHGVGSPMSGASQTEPRQAGDVRVVDYMGVEDQRAFGGVSPFGYGPVGLDLWAGSLGNHPD